MERMATPTSYAGALRKEIEHAPIGSTTSKKQRDAKLCKKEDQIELELVATIANQGKYGAIYNTKAIPGERLLEGLIRSKIGFLLNTQVIMAALDDEKVKKEITYLQQCVVIAYFVGSGKSEKEI